MTAIVILTGAGISAESGIDTFRGKDGVWENRRIEEVATAAAFATDPELVHRFYNSRRSRLLSDEIKPNAAHLALARLERESQRSVSVVTQNVDNLHERAGTQSLIHMHGELLKSYCVNCEAIAPAAVELTIRSICGNCYRVSSLRPHIVWFGEMPFQMDRIIELVSSCGLFISIGTSGNVYPAAGFARLAIEAGARAIELNLEASNTPVSFDDSRYGAATQIVPQLVDELLN